MSYHPAIVANALLQRGRERGVFIDHMKLQKLVFLVHAWSLASQGVPAVNREPEAWDYGPVFTELYSKLRDQGRAPVTQLISSYNPASGLQEVMVPNPGDQATWSMVDYVLNRYGNLSAIQLSALSHEAGGPWEITRRENRSFIPDETIQRYYREQSKLGNPRI